MAHLLKYDSIYGTLPNKVTYDDSHIIVDGKAYPLFQQRDVKNVDGMDWVQKLLLSRPVNMQDVANRAPKIVCPSADM